MDVHGDRKCATAWGRVSIEDLGPSSLSSTRNPRMTIPAHRWRYVWEPPIEISAHLPSGFSVSLNCFMGRDGVRHFIPTGDAGPFILHASLGGCALLSRMVGLSPEQRSSYRVTRLLYQQGPRLREHLSRTFCREQDLYIPRGGRISQDERHILPTDLGLDARGCGKPWKPYDLIEQGEEAATAAGDPNPDEATSIRLGLLAAARRNPLKLTSLSEAESRQLVRLALFDLGPHAGPISAQLVEKVEERLLFALGSHLEDDTTSFHRWFFDKIDNVVHQVAKKKKGGVLSREVVRQVHLETVFRAFTYVGDCVHLQMTAFCRALPEPLTAVEQALFSSMYRKDPRLGGLPLILLHDRFDFLREAVLEIWERPRDRKRVGVLLRMLNYYAAMASKKREGDRQYKRQRLHRSARGCSALMLPLDQERDIGELEPDRFQEIAAELREIHGASCRCNTTRDWRARVVEEEKTTRDIVLEDGCGACGAVTRVKVSVKEFEKVGRSLMSM